MKIWYRALLIAGMCMGLMGCGKDKDVEAPELLEPVGSVSDAVTVTKGDISSTKIYDAQVIPYTEELGFEIDGTVLEVKARLGDTVKKGDIIGVLTGAGDGNEYDSVVEQINQQKSTYSEENHNAESDIRIMETEKKQLQNSLGNAPDGNKKDIKKQLEVKKVDIEIAKTRLSGNRAIQDIELKELERKKKAALEKLKENYLYATMDGVITYVNMEPGMSVSANDFVVALSDTDRKQIKSEFVSKRDLTAADDYYVMYKNKHYAVVQQEYDPAGIDELVEQELVPRSYFDVKDSNAEFDIGESLELYVISDEQKDALIIPSNALYREGSVCYVYKQEGNTKVKTEVTVGTTTTSMVQIVDGIGEGDVVYVKE